MLSIQYTFMKRKQIAKAGLSILAVLGVGSLSACNNSSTIKENMITAKPYLKLDGIKGPSTEQKHLEWFELESFYLDLSASDDLVSNVCSFSLPINGNSLRVINNIANGKVIKKAIIDVLDTEKNNYITDTYTFDDFTIVGCEVTNMLETVTFVSRAITVKHTPYGQGAIETMVDFSEKC